MLNGWRSRLAAFALGPILALAAAAAPARADTITVTHWGAAFYGAPYAVAMAKGFFKAHGVDVTGVLTSTGGGTSVRNTLAGDLPFGEVALAAAVEAINHGQPIKIIGSGVDSVADILWIAKPGAPYHSVKDLKGKKVGFTAPGSVTNMLILMALKASGMTPSDVQLVAAGGIGANLSAVVNGALDAGMTGEPTWSENQSKVQPVFWVKDVLPPNMMQTVTITTDDYAKSDPAKLRALLAGRAEGVAFINEHTDEAADIVAAAYHGDPALYRRVFHNFVALHYWSDGRMDYDGMNRMVEGLQIVGKQNGPVDWSKIVDTSFLPAGMKAASN
ncbi:MAG: ABC transporter substrate-binding protein [Proteobacteria bacterium]|nr:ABC transporter substrate-binding protein [Pseudomonadota bacterium]